MIHQKTVVDDLIIDHHLNERRKPMKGSKIIAASLLSVILCLLSTGCTPETPRQQPVDSKFPQVQGTSLEGNIYTIPDEFIGEPTLLLIGYIQDSQFDIDRWLLGLVQLEVPIAVREIPTVRGLIPRLIANKIDSGMRSGIPKEDWGAVITVYKDADVIANFLGTEDPLNARVALLDANGNVIWFHDRGYSAKWISDLDRTVRALRR